jgi:hypothetical protein
MTALEYAKSLVVKHGIAKVRQAWLRTQLDNAHDGELDDIQAMLDEWITNGGKGILSMDERELLEDIVEYYNHDRDGVEAWAEENL